ncbi:MAG: hypothetical protein CVV49_01970 [Spirochaetae bacterium HGW-Spirochaetae-5]|nr:MAG: hypothetical protein CVV49_01970 [Spirochaetae bacterium HGW-Spirochaetae-5]
MNIILIIILITILLILAWAVFSNKTEPVIISKPIPEKEQIDEPEKILRRRSADRAIEKEFPAERAGSDIPGEIPYERDDPSGQIQLPFPANDIITDGSRFKLYKRALINSEIYARRGDIETAVSLFKGVKDRILDSDIRSKIESNINYLNHFRHRRDEDFKKKIDSASSGQQQTSGELRLRIDGPVPQTINIGMPEKSSINTDEIIEKLSEQITKELGTLKNDIETLKSKPDDKFDLDDYAEFSNLQHEFNNLKERFEELTEERLNTLKELNKLREMKEDELEKEKIKDHSPENHEILKDIRKEIDNLSGLKHSLDSLHNKIEDISSFQIPESKNQPAIIQAKYESPIPIHFDPKPVLELLDKINQQRREDKAELPIPEEIIPQEEIIPEEDISELLTDIDEIIETEPEDSGDKEPESVFDEVTTAAEPELDEPEPEEPEEDISLDDFTTLEAEEFINEITDETDEVPHEEEALFEEPEIKYEEVDEEIVTDEDLAAELSDDELGKISEDEEAEPEPVEPFIEIKESIPEEPEKDEPSAEEILKTEKEKEIEKHTDAEEDPNDFDLLSDMGKVKDDSTLTDEDIFEKILKDEKSKGDDSAFEIIGDAQKDEQEFTLNDSILEGKQKAEQDFYKKFIKADRIKKRELPILKVSYDFKKLPDEFSLSREKNILEYSFYKYKPMLQKADEYIKHRHVRDAINYYRVVLDQNIPIEFKAMIKRNIRDLTEYLEKYLSSE